jgi:hypothetical protein
MARRKAPQIVAVKGKNHGRERIMVVNGKGKRRMMWRDELEGK